MLLFGLFVPALVGRLLLTRLSFRAIGALVARGVMALRLNWLSWLRSAGSFLLSSAVLSGITWTAVEIWETIMEATYTIKEFDWNQSDASLKQQIQANNNQMIQMLGRFGGSGAVRLVTLGVFAGAKMKYPVVAGRVALELAQDTQESLRGEFVSMVNGVRSLAIENGLLSLVLGLRQRHLFGLRPRAEDGPVDTFAGRIDKTVQAIPNEGLRNFVMGFLEGAEDAFWDVGYIVANTLDDHVAASRYANQRGKEVERTIILEPDATTKEEIVITGPQESVIATTTEVLAIHRLIQNRDVGQIVGIPAESFPRAKHMIRQLVVCFKAKKEPPYWTPDGRAKEVQYTIPDAKPGLSWQEIKGAARPFTWGPWRATANLDNNRQMAVYGATGQEAEQQLRSLLLLSTAAIVTLSISEEKIRDPRHIKRPTTVWPAFATLVTSPTDIQGRPSGGDSALRRERRRIKLWPDQEPDDFGGIG